MMLESKKLVITLSVNGNNDVSTVAFTVANAAITKGLDVGMFLTSDGVELSKDGGNEFTHVAPFKKLNELIDGFVEKGGTLWACSPCFNHRGLEADKTVSGTEVVGAGPMLEWIASGAQTLSF
ncbi:MAG: DsrE family protein [Cyanothece sp. SIO1E1]|nr:DsrE family protein [Cyanothece sp. SIO1E1]